MNTVTDTPKRNLFRVLLAFWIILLSFGMAELILRVFFEEPEVKGNYWGKDAFIPSAEAGYRHTPEFSGYAIRKGTFRSYVKISKEGLRQTNLQAQNKYDKKLLLLGDSFTFGLGVGEEDMFASLIQKPLNETGIGVINGAQTGYGVQQEVNFGKLLIERYKPSSILLCLFLGNDIEGDYLGDYRKTDVRYGYRLSKDRFLPGRLGDYCRTHLYTLLYIDGFIGDRRTKSIHLNFKKAAKKDPVKMMSPTIHAIRDFQILVKSRGLAFGVILIPPGHLGEMFYEPMKNELRNLGISFLDLNEKNFTSEDRFELDGHWNVAGHSKAAAAITPFALQLVASGS